MIDICFNLTHESFRKDATDVIDRARVAGVRAMIIPGTSIADSTNAIKLAKGIPDIIFPTAGVHPHIAKEWHSDSRKQLQNIVQNNAVVAVGETGLDYYRNFSPRTQQLLAFEEQINLAEATELPLFLHQRDAHKDFISILRQSAIQAAVVHCFTGNRDELNAYLELDLYIGITGWVCDERRGTHLEELIKDIPLNRLLIETDAPYLLPRNLNSEDRPRNRRNEPAFLKHINEHIATQLGVSANRLAQRTSENACQLFGISI